MDSGLDASHRPGMTYKNKMPSDPLDPDAPRAITPSETALSRRVDLTTLRLFIAICEEHESRPPRRHRGVRRLQADERFRAVLWRHAVQAVSKGMALTPAGEALLHHARLTLLNVEKIAVELSEYSHGVRGHVRMLPDGAGEYGDRPDP
jgi:hypothetical protein